MTDFVESQIAQTEMAMSSGTDIEVIEHEIGDPHGLDAAEGLDVAGLSPGRLAWKRYWRHKGAAFSTIILGVLVLFVIATPITARYGVNEQVRDISEGNNVFLPPQQIAWFGTDDIGRDLY
mgnify:CR=1 FL=1